MKNRHVTRVNEKAQMSGVMALSFSATKNTVQNTMYVGKSSISYVIILTQQRISRLDFFSTMMQVAIVVP